MNELCFKCKSHLSSPWKYCPNCGASVPHVTPEHSPGSAVAEGPPLHSVYGGFILGAIVMPMSIIVGTMLCLTGLGAFAGVPLIICGIFAPLLGIVLGSGELHLKNR